MTNFNVMLVVIFILHISMIPMTYVIVTTVLEIKKIGPLVCQFAIKIVQMFLHHMLKNPMIANVIQVIKHFIFLVISQNSIVKHFVIQILQPCIQQLTNVNVMMVLPHWQRKLIQTNSGVL